MIPGLLTRVQLPPFHSADRERGLPGAIVTVSPTMLFYLERLSAPPPPHKLRTVSRQPHRVKSAQAAPRPNPLSESLR